MTRLWMGPRASCARGIAWLFALAAVSPAFADDAAQPGDDPETGERDGDADLPDGSESTEQRDWDARINERARTNPKPVLEVAVPVDVTPSTGLGIGASTTLAGLSGIDVRSFVTPEIGVQLTVGLDRSSDELGSGTTAISGTQMTVNVALAGSYKLAYWQRGHLSAFLGLDIQTISNTQDVPMMPTTEQSATDFLTSLGLMGEYFPTQYLSLFVRAGVLVDVIGDDEISGGVIVPNIDNTGFGAELIAQPLGSAGFTVWFK